MFKAYVEYAFGGYRVEFYRDDNDNSGYGGHAEIAHWYVDSRAEGLALVAAGQYPKGLIWKKIGPWSPEKIIGSAAWCEVQGDNY